MRRGQRSGTLAGVPGEPLETSELQRAGPRRAASVPGQQSLWETGWRGVVAPRSRHPLGPCFWPGQLRDSCGVSREAAPGEGREAGGVDCISQAGLTWSMTERESEEGQS